MKKTKIKLLCTALFLLGNICFAKTNTYSLEDAIDVISKDISERCEKKEIIAILDFDSETPDMSNYLNGELTSRIFENSTLQVVTRQHMDKVESELKFHSSGRVSDSTALSIGERLGAHKIIFGQLDELDNTYILQVKMLDVESGSYSLFKRYAIARSSRTEQLLSHAAKIYKSSIGFIIEANKNSISSVSPGVGICFDYSLIRNISLGFNAIVSYDVSEKDNSIYCIEPLAFLRWYVVSPTGEPSAGIFLEPHIGCDLLLVNSEIKPSLNIGAAFGFRIVSGNFYIEPVLRGGYPYMFGAGISAGCRF